MKDKTNQARIAPGVRKVSWTETAEGAIGYHRCEWCNAETPSPTDDVVIEFVREHPNASTLWPMREHGPSEGWQPPGWHWVEDGWLCPECRDSMVVVTERAKAARRAAAR